MNNTFWIHLGRLVLHSWLWNSSELPKRCSISLPSRLSLLHLVSVPVCFSESVSMLKWQGLRVLDSSWPQWETSHLHANLNHCSLTICRWNISNSCQSREVAERLLCLYVHFCIHYRKWFHIFIQDDPQKNPVLDHYRALYNPSERSGVSAAMRIPICFLLNCDSDSTIFLFKDTCRLSGSWFQQRPVVLWEGDVSRRC